MWGGEVDDKKSYLRIAGVIILLLALAAGGCLCSRYYDRAGAADGHDAAVTVRDITADNRAAGAAVDDAAGQVADAEAALDRADAGLDGAADAAGRVQDSLAADQAILDECDGILADGHRGTAAARAIFADVDRANQGAVAQAGRP